MTEYLKSPLHLSKCAIQLMGLYALERYKAFAEMMEDAEVDFGGDDE